MILFSFFLYVYFAMILFSFFLYVYFLFILCLICLILVMSKVSQNFVFSCLDHNYNAARMWMSIFY